MIINQSWLATLKYFARRKVSSAGELKHSPFDAVKSMATVKLIWVLRERKRETTCDQSVSTPGSMVAICCRGSENRPAADVVQEGELGVHQAGQQGDLHHKSGRQSLISRNTAGRCEISSARSRMQTGHTLDRNQQLVISERREWIKPGVYSLRLKPKTSFVSEHRAWSQSDQ